MAKADGWREPLVEVSQRGSIVWLTLDSPSNRNALSRRLLRELAAGLGEATRVGARMVVLTGVGGTFCSGADLAERRSPPPPEEDDVTVSEIMLALARAPYPVLARVNGHVRAGGMGLVAASDLAVAPASATFAFSEVRVGVAPAVIAVPALRRMAPRALEWAMLTGSPFSAEQAERSGLLTAALEDMEETDRWVASVARAVKEAGPEAVRETKELVLKLWDLDYVDGLRHAEGVSDRLFASDEAAEGMAAFLEKRLPNWT